MFKKIISSLALLLATSSIAFAAPTGCFSSLNGTAGITVQARSGNSYTSDANGNICGVAAQDSNDMDNAGFVNWPPTQTGSKVPFVAIGANGLNNPIVQNGFYDIVTASVNQAGGIAFISGISGRQIIPSGGALTVTASGTASAATSVKFICSSGLALVTYNIAALVTNVPVTPYSSNANITAASSLGRGCPAGDGIVASNVGTNLATTTDIFVNFPYIIQ